MRYINPRLTYFYFAYLLTSHPLCGALSRRGLNITPIKLVHSPSRSPQRPRLQVPVANTIVVLLPLHLGLFAELQTAE